MFGGRNRVAVRRVHHDDAASGRAFYVNVVNADAGAPMTRSFGSASIKSLPTFVSLRTIKPSKSRIASANLPRR
jgi:hypothetical protein